MLGIILVKTASPERQDALRRPFSVNLEGDRSSSWYENAGESQIFFLLGFGIEKRFSDLISGMRCRHLFAKKE